MELVEAVTDLFRGDWEGLIQRAVWGRSLLTNDMGEIEKFLVLFKYNGVGDWSGGYAHCYPHCTGTVRGLINGPPVKLPNFNFLNIVMNTLFDI